MSADPAAPPVLGEPIPHVCTIADVARFLRCSRRSIERMLARHELALVELERIGHLRRFTGRSVEALTSGRFAAPRLRGRA